MLPASRSSTPISGHGESFKQARMKSSSRASLLNSANTSLVQPSCDSLTDLTKLKRFKSLPGGKARKKRRAPSPPKNVEPYRPQSKTETKPELQLALAPEKPAVPEGVKLRRRAKCLQTKYNMNHRQSMFCAKIQQAPENRRHSWYIGKERRKSMEDLSSDEESNHHRSRQCGRQTLQVFTQNLIRSPSDSSLMYLNQLSSNSDLQLLVDQAPLTQPVKPVLPPRLPAKTVKKPFETCEPIRGDSQASFCEGIYDSVPKPRSCLSQKQLEYNQIYDVPRRLIGTRNQGQKAQFNSVMSLQTAANKTEFKPLFDRAVSAQGNQAGNGKVTNGNGKIKRAKDVSNLFSSQDIELERPILPPRRKRKTPPLPPKGNFKSLDCLEMTGSEISEEYERCQSYATNHSKRFEDNNLGKAYRKSPFSESMYSSSTSTLMESFSSLPPPPSDLDSQSFDLDLEGEDPNQTPTHRPISKQPDTISTFSSVSSVTLLHEDALSGYDSASLPGDPFPQGLSPSSSTSTIGSTPPSITSPLLPLSPGVPEEMSVSLPPPPPPVEEEALEMTASAYFPPPPMTDEPFLAAAVKEGGSPSSTPVVTRRSPLIKHNSDTNLSSGKSDDILEEQEYTLLTDQASDSQDLKYECPKEESESHLKSPDTIQADDKALDGLKDQLEQEIQPDEGNEQKDLNPEQQKSSSVSSKKSDLIENQDDILLEPKESDKGIEVSDNVNLESDSDNLEGQQSVNHCQGPGKEESSDNDQGLNSELQRQDSAEIVEFILNDVVDNIFLGQIQNEDSNIQESEELPTTVMNFEDETLSDSNSIKITNEIWSRFDPGSFKSCLLPGHDPNQPLDPVAISLAHSTLLETPLSILALHLTKVDHELFFGQEYQSVFSVDEEHFQMDVLERSVCLRTFVIVSILATMHSAEASKLLARWISIAEESRTRCGNEFALFNILSALVSDQLSNWSEMWTDLQQVSLIFQILLEVLQNFAQNSSESLS